MPDTTREQRVQSILHTYLQAIDRGEKPERQAILDAHPDLRDELAEYFADASKLEKMARSLKTVTLGGEGVVVSPTLGKIRYFGDYELIDEIARGGMGVVFKAKQTSLHRSVALKMILKGELASPGDVRRFQQEAEAAANLDHPNIVPIYEVGEHDGQQYFSMKLIDGKNLSAAIPGLRQDLRRAVELIVLVARGIAYAHRCGILHRDLKPANILVDSAGQPHITDFGLAKRLEQADPLTRSGVIVGTPSYMSPEQARGAKALTVASDVYSIGAVLFELLAGRPPFHGQTHVDVLLQVLEAEPPSPRSFNAKVDRDLDVMTLKCLEKDPRRRYTSADELADDLERWLRGEPVLARPVGQAARLGRWVRRRPLVAALAIVSACGILALIGGVINFLYSSRLETANAKLSQSLQESAIAREAEETQRKIAQAALLRAERADYYNRIALAERAWTTDQVARADEILEECPEALRGWEWSYAKGLCSAELASWKSPDNYPASFTYSPDGKILATAGFDVQLWDAETLKPIRKINGEAGPVRFSPDGKQLAFAVSGRMQRVEVETGKRLKTLALQTSIAGIRNFVAFRPTGKHALLLTTERLTVFDLQTEKEVFHDAKVEGFADYSPDGTTLVRTNRTRDPDVSAKVSGLVPYRVEISFHDADTGAEQARVASPLAQATVIRFGRDGRQMLVGGTNSFGQGVVCVYDFAARKLLDAIVIHEKGLHGVALSPDGRTFAVTHPDRKVALWDLKTRSKVQVLRGHRGTGGAVAFSPDGDRLLSSGEDRTIKIWDLTTPAEGFEFSAFRPVFSPDGRIAASAEQVYFAGKKQWVTSLGFWDVATGDRLPLKIADQPPHIAAVQWSPKGDLLAVVASKKDEKFETVSQEILVYDAVTGARTHSFPQKSGDVTSFLFLPDGKSLLANIVTQKQDKKERLPTFDSTLRSYSMTGEPAKAWSTTVPERQGLFAISRDGVRIYCGIAYNDKLGYNRYRLRCYNLSTEALEYELPEGIGFIERVAASPTDDRIAVAVSDFNMQERIKGPVHIVDGQGQVTRTLRAHTERAAAVAFSPDGTRLVTGGGDTVEPGVVKIWDPQTGQLVLSMHGFAEPVVHVSFSRDGQKLIAVAGGKVRVSDIGPVSAETRRQRQAVHMVKRLFDEPMLRADVLERIESQPFVAPDVRDRARAVARRWPESPQIVARHAFFLFGKANEAEAAYRRAIRSVQAALEDDPDSITELETLALGHYRLKEYQPALAAADKVDRLRADAKTPLSYLQLALRALIHHRLGHADLAQTHAGQMEKQVPASPGYVAEELVEEARSTLGRKKPDTKSSKGT